MSARINIIGAGGHAKVVIGTARAANLKPVAVFDDDVSTHGTAIMGVPVLGSVSSMADAEQLPTVIAVGDNLIRKRISEEYNCNWATIVHPAAIVDETACIERGTVIFAGAVIQPFAKIGQHSIINTASTVDHDCVLGDYSQLAPGAHLSGTVALGEGVFLGTGSCTTQGISVGLWSVIGAGAAVIDDIPANSVAVGIPAKVIKSV